jgi:hypothetical protein
VDLLREHLGLDTSGAGVREAMALYREVARENTARRRNKTAMSALAHALEPAAYGS